MKTKGIDNATRRLEGARQLGSALLLARAEEEARLILGQASAWLERSQARPELSASRAGDCQAMAAAIEKLQAALNAGEAVR